MSEFLMNYKGGTIYKIGTRTKTFYQWIPRERITVFSSVTNSNLEVLKQIVDKTTEKNKK